MGVLGQQILSVFLDTWERILTASEYLLLLEFCDRSMLLSAILGCFSNSSFMPFLLCFSRNLITGSNFLCAVSPYFF